MNVHLFLTLIASTALSTSAIMTFGNCFSIYSCIKSNIECQIKPMFFGWIAIFVVSLAYLIAS